MTTIIGVMSWSWTWSLPLSSSCWLQVMVPVVGGVDGTCPPPVRGGRRRGWRRLERLLCYCRLFPTFANCRIWLVAAATDRACGTIQEGKSFPLLMGVLLEALATKSMVAIGQLHLIGAGLLCAQQAVSAFFGFHYTVVAAFSCQIDGKRFVREQ